MGRQCTCLHRLHMRLFKCGCCRWVLWQCLRTVVEVVSIPSQAASSTAIPRSHGMAVPAAQMARTRSRLPLNCCSHAQSWADVPHTPLMQLLGCGLPALPTPNPASTSLPSAVHNPHRGLRGRLQLVIVVQRHWVQQELVLQVQSLRCLLSARPCKACGGAPGLPWASPALTRGGSSAPQPFVLLETGELLASARPHGRQRPATGAYTHFGLLDRPVRKREPDLHTKIGSVYASRAPSPCI